MNTKTLTVELSEDLYAKFVGMVTARGGLWRSRRKKESATQALEGAVTAALMLFLQNLEGEAELPEFREYARRKYPELNEDMIIMFEDLIEDLIKRLKMIASALKPRTIH